MTGFREHLKNLATFDLNMNIDNKYHDMVEDEIQIINDIMAHESIEETNDEEIAKATDVTCNLLFLFPWISMHCMFYEPSSNGLII
jgi:hypothetical protein